MDFKQVEDYDLVETLRPKSIFNLPDFSVGKYINCFALTGRTNDDYCEITKDSKGRTCKEIGTITPWNKNKSEGKDFEIYHKEYKRYFAGIKSNELARRCPAGGAAKPGRGH